MNLRDLHYLIAVADLHSFIKAAERCYISQPTLSAQIKKLEESLGVQLFERTNKKVLITDVGITIVNSARRILQEVDIIKQLAEIARDPFAGNLKLGAFPTLSSYLFPPLVPLIKQAMPKVRLILIEEKTEFLVQQLKSGEIDAALLALPINEEFLESLMVFEDQFLLAVADDHPLAGNSLIYPAELGAQQLLLLDEGHCLRGQALQVCSIHGLEEQQDVRASSLETLRQMVRYGTGVTFMPRIALRADAGIRYIPFVSPAPSRSIGLVWRKTSPRSQLFTELSRLIQQAANMATKFPQTNT